MAHDPEDCPAAAGGQPTREFGDAVRAGPKPVEDAGDLLVDAQVGLPADDLPAVAGRDRLRPGEAAAADGHLVRRDAQLRGHLVGADVPAEQREAGVLAERHPGMTAVRGVRRAQ
ncbi:hypothetical protein GCM10010495_71340 [Kitasatospora herbaricolor]|nr:hypothetical protein GCM10010495_71340 [Kitasatospora herbaricolor]